MRSSLVAVLVVALLPVGCVSRAPRNAPELQIEVPASWSAAGNPGPADATPWWGSFGDPGLDGFLADLLENNPDLDAAAHRVAAARSRAVVAGAPRKPAASIGYAAARQGARFPAFPAPPNTFSTHSLEVSVSWEADLWGRLGAEARGAAADWQASEAERRSLALSLTALAGKLWYSLAEADLQADLARSTVASLRAHTGQVRSRYENGLRPGVELRLAQANLAAAESTLASWRRHRDGVARRLQVLAGRYPSGRVDGGSDLALPEPIPVGLPADLVGRRPDLLAAQRRLVAADERFTAARKALYPRLSLTATGGTLTSELRDLLDGDFRVWSLLGNLTQPLFQGGRLRATRDGAESERDAALAEYASAVLAAFAEVETALAAEPLLADRRDRLGTAAQELTTAVRLAEARYREGVGDYLTVLEAQTRAFDARSRLLNAQRELLENRIDLHLALGGGFAPEGT